MGEKRKDDKKDMKKKVKHDDKKEDMGMLKKKVKKDCMK